MTKFNKFRTGLVGAAAASGLLLAAGSAFADTIVFAPGVTNGDSFNTYGLAGNTNLQGTNVDQFTWRAVNNTQPDAPADPALGLPFQHSQWAINFNTVTGDFVSETFTFILSTTTGPAFSDNTKWGQNIDGFGPFTESHITMEATLSGTVTNVSADSGVENADVDTLEITYTGANFSMFFHPTGDTEDAGAIPLATFGNDPFAPGEFGFGVDGAANKTTLEWEAKMTSAAPGVFTIDGQDVNTLPLDITFKTTTQVVQVKEGDSDATNPGNVRRLIVGLDLGGTTVIEQRIPEPGTVALFGIGLIGLGIAARRRRNAA